MGTITILPETTKDPISLIGRRAGVCWGADISDEKKNYRRGLDCLESNHGRTLEFVNVEMVLDGYSARVIREWYTHIGGAPTRLPGASSAGWSSTWRNRAEGIGKPVSPPARLCRGSFVFLLYPP